MRVCYVCGRGGSLGKHHIIHGHGKRKACETRESLIDICYACHKLAHNTETSALNITLKLQLQDIYFQKGYAEEKVRMLMGGKLYRNINKRYSPYTIYNRHLRNAQNPLILLGFIC